MSLTKTLASTARRTQAAAEKLATTWEQMAVETDRFAAAYREQLGFTDLQTLDRERDARLEAAGGTFRLNGPTVIGEGVEVPTEVPEPSPAKAAKAKRRKAR